MQVPASSAAELHNAMHDVDKDETPVMDDYS
jgi:hypothetical protein